MQNYKDMIAELTRYVESGKSGTLFIKTSDNKSASIALSKGNITDCRFRHFKGMKAVEMLRAVEVSKTSFSTEMVLSKGDTDLVSTDQLLRLLADQTATDFSAQETGGQTELVRDSGVTSGEIPGSVVRDMESILAEYVGPLAGVLCASYLQDQQEVLSSRTQFAQVLNAIADDIGNEREGEEFKKRVLGLLDI